MLERREFLKRAGLAGASFALSSCAADGQEQRALNARETLDALLKKNREHEKFSYPARNNHVPMTLIALYRMGATPAQMQRYTGTFDLSAGSAPQDGAKKGTITRETWRNQLGRGAFPAYIGFFDDWTQQASNEAVLKEAVPVLMKGTSSVAYHALLRLGYAVDYDSRDEIVFSLAFWAAGFYAGPDIADAKDGEVEPDALLADVVKAASDVRLKQTGSIDRNIRQVYDIREFAKLWRPIKLPKSGAIDRVSELVMEAFTQSQHFTLLHALTSCQAMRLLLPYLGDPRESLSAYWHSVCAAYLTISLGKFEAGKDAAPEGGTEWKELFTKAAASEKALEHTAKLTYSCWLDSQHYKRDKYRALALRELKKPSPFV